MAIAHNNIKINLGKMIYLIAVIFTNGSLIVGDSCALFIFFMLLCVFLLNAKGPSYYCIFLYYCKITHFHFYEVFDNALMIGGKK